ncbi:hypothetical protein ACVIW2_001471 [Bradyrhizobium huanghuaihaiense]
MTVRRVRPIYVSDVRRLGGVVTVSVGRDHVEGHSVYVVRHVSRGGDIAFQSRPIPDEGEASRAADVLAQFTGSEVRR